MSLRNRSAASLLLAVATSWFCHAYFYICSCSQLVRRIRALSCHLHPTGPAAQNVLERVVTNHCHSSSRTLLQQLHWLPIEYRANFKIANSTFRTLHSSQLAYLFSALHAYHFTRSLRLSNTNLLSVSFVCTLLGAHSFSVAGPKNLELSPSSFPNVHVPVKLISVVISKLIFSSSPSNPISSFLLAPKFSFRWPLCAFINYL